MRLATVLAVAVAYTAVVAALDQHEAAHPMLRELATTDENQSQLVPPRFVFMADSAQVTTSAPTCQWGGNNACSFALASNNKLNLVDTCALSVPVPTDNYVNDQRINKNDDSARLTASARPYVQIKSSKQVPAGSPAVDAQTPLTTWYEYWKEPTVVQKQIGFTSTGVYDLTIEATDYDASATCSWCVAITDTFRPVFAGGWTCPAATASPQTLTIASLAAARSAETEYDTHVSSSTNNPESGADCSTTDNEVKNFLQYDEDSDDSPDDYADTNIACYGDSAYGTNMNTLKTTPISSGSFKLQLPDPLSDVDKLRWCCKKSRSLKEQFYDYACPSTCSPTPTCVGDSGAASTCNFYQCLTATPPDIISKAELDLKSTVQSTSQSVVAALGMPPTTPVVNDIYRTVQCTTVGGSDPACSYSQKLSDLFDITTAFAGTFPAPPGSGPGEFIFWRYKLAGGDWVVWNPTSDSDISFSSSTTHIVIEAWTAAGKCSTSSFDFHVYPHSILTCTDFEDMWVGSPKTAPEAATFCNVPGSDFSLVTMKYDYSKIFPATQPGGTSVTGNYQDGECKIVVKESEPTENDFSWDTYPIGKTASLLDRSQAAPFNKDLAIELVHNPNTAQKTAVHVECTFRRTMLSNVMTAADDTTVGNSFLATDPNTIMCTYDFTLVDCDPPLLELGVQPSAVCSDECAGDVNPGLGEACAGTIVTSSSSGTFVTTPSAPQTCCNKCVGQELQCAAAGGSSSVMACNPPTYGTSPPPMEPLMAQLSAVEQEIASGETLTALLGASAMVAVVALVVVKRRADAAAHAREAEDAYYPLLE